MKTTIGRKEKQWRIWAVILLVVIAIAIYVYYTRNVTSAEVVEEPTLQTTTVRKGDIVITAVGRGNLMSGSEIALGFRSGGVLVDLAVAVGDEVTAGQVLARLDDTAVQIQVAQAELNLEQTQAKLETARNAITQTLEASQANLAAAQADYDSLVLESQHIGDQLTSARVNLEQAQEQLIFAQDAYNVTWDPARDWELSIKNRAAALENERAATLRALEKAKDDLEIARANYNLAVLNLDADSATHLARVKLLAAQQALDESLSGATVQTADWSVQQAELALAAAHLSLESATLYAPANGTIIAVSANAGDVLGTNPIITLADLSALQVRFYLEESDLSKVTVGNKVRVVFDALPDQEFSGQVTRIDPALVTVDGTLAIQGWATLVDVASQIMFPIGLTAEIEIIAGEAYKTLLVPVQALRELGPGQFAVFVVSESGELKLRPVEVGLRDFANAQILSGLEQGDVVSTGTVETE
ncbi:MAG: efflux RND transporter periplasmic adaptor subunit [Anaerolineae bacterium]|nr:efflux RND transporter periplasmic adaptor subunit [Anaerolineae bacterium]